MPIPPGASHLIAVHQSEQATDVAFDAVWEEAQPSNTGRAKPNREV